MKKFAKILSIIMLFLIAGSSFACGGKEESNVEF